MRQLQDIFIRLNDVRPFRSKLLNKISGNISRELVKRFATAALPFYFRKHPGIYLYKEALQAGRKSEAIVSLTSFPQRIGVVWLVIECLLRQTRVPKKIVIYLSRNQFPTAESIPDTIKAYPSDVVELRLVEGDIRSHKKYWYTIEDFKGCPIVLVDDDIIYDSHLIEDLEDASTLYEKVIACCWGVNMKWNPDGTPKPYSQWAGIPKVGEISDSFFYGSGGGTYFPIGSLEGSHQPKEDIMRVCPMADDIWLNAITRRNGYKSVLVRKYNSVAEWRIKNNVRLQDANNTSKQNDVQLLAVQNFFIKKALSNPFMKH
jgi:hypothetical protein